MLSALGTTFGIDFTQKWAQLGPLMITLYSAASQGP